MGIDSRNDLTIIFPFHFGFLITNEPSFVENKLKLTSGSLKLLRTINETKTNSLEENFVRICFSKIGLKNSLNHGFPQR